MIWGTPRGAKGPDGRLVGIKQWSTVVDQRLVAPAAAGREQHRKVSAAQARWGERRVS